MLSQTQNIIVKDDLTCQEVSDSINLDRSDDE